MRKDGSVLSQLQPGFERAQTRIGAQLGRVQQRLNADPRARLAGGLASGFMLGKVVNRIGR